MSPLDSLQVIAVPAGTIIRDDSGRALAVTPVRAVFKGGVLHMTIENYEALKTKVGEKTA